MDQHVKAVGVLHSIFAGIGLASVLLVTLVFGAFMHFLAGSALGTSFGPQGVQFLTTIVMSFMLIIVLCSLPGIIAGFAVMQYQPWARWVIVVLSIIHLAAFPVGTVVGAYSLWVLLNPEVAGLFDRRSG